MTQERASSVLTERARTALARMARERAEREKQDGGNGKGDTGTANDANAKRANGKASAVASEPEGVTLNDFVAYMPAHSLYIDERDVAGGKCQCSHRVHPGCR